ncbi:unnamed protein product [Strongylus vulgaris]|uniref:NADP-dependent oxidoreductase domain-containing protein n=1 Tax=Strongylus vulgaris TaxID=40348 RepID=A0A3P7J7X3_STRVU|nr:unnamed protein product [Strongylus vulgaris]
MDLSKLLEQIRNQQHARGIPFPSELQMYLGIPILLLLYNIGIFSAATIERIKLNTGTYMPVLGLGTWQATNETELSAALKTALDNGYRLIGKICIRQKLDTAFLYDNEAMIGKVLKEYITSGKVKREDLFITTKIQNNGYKKVELEKAEMLRSSILPSARTPYM